MRKYFSLLGKPALFGTVIWALWSLFIWPLHIPEDTQVSAGMAMGYIGFPLFLIGLVLHTAFQEYQQVRALIRTCRITKTFKDQKNIDRFIILLETRIHMVMYLFIVVVSFLSILFICLINYRVYFYGSLAVFCSSSVKYFLLMVAYELDNPFVGRFKAEDIPEDWKSYYEAAKNNNGSSRLEKFANFFL